jgi:hypothetical protein
LTASLRRCGPAPLAAAGLRRSQCGFRDCRGIHHYSPIDSCSDERKELLFKLCIGSSDGRLGERPSNPLHAARLGLKPPQFRRKKRLRFHHVDYFQDLTDQRIKKVMNTMKPTSI